MFHMQHREGDPESVDGIFGFLVTSFRNGKGLTQRQFAEKLTELGMKVDASAVSRIEKGERSVRLPEAMIIAEALDVEINSLVHYSRSPSQEFRSARREANGSLHELQEAISKMYFHIWEVYCKLEKRPELLSTLEDDTFGIPESPEGYLDWVAQRLASSWKVSPEDVLAVTSQRMKDQFVKIVENLARMLLATGAEYADLFDDVEYEDEIVNGINSETA
jgi:transcriptional regulator with XRE-family HTH domain